MSEFNDIACGIFNDFVCPQCGIGVAADEDGCCAMCGATCLSDKVRVALCAAIIAQRDNLVALLRKMPAVIACEYHNYERWAKDIQTALEEIGK